MKHFLLSCFIVLLSSCGWQLRGSNSGDSNHSQATTISLSAADEYTSLYREFDRELRRQSLLAENTADSTSIYLVSEHISNRIASLGSGLAAAEYELVMRVYYQLPKDSPTRIVTIRDSFTNSKTSTAATDNEQEKLLNEMRLKAIRQIIDQARLTQ